MSLRDALAYPFRDEAWRRRLLPLALLQLVPVVGQMILIGYGVAVGRAVATGEPTLPPLHWQQHLRDGALILVTGLLYLVPVLGLVPNILVFDAALRFLGIEPASGSFAAAAIDVVIAAIIALLTSLIVVGLHIGGVRYATEAQGLKALFGATGNARLLVRDRRAGLRLVINLALLTVLTSALVALGLLLFVLPGLLMFVIYIVAIWYLCASFVRERTELAL